jgi:hypothetical protein
VNRISEASELSKSCLIVWQPGAYERNAEVSGRGDEPERPLTMIEQRLNFRRSIRFQVGGTYEGAVRENQVWFAIGRLAQPLRELRRV